MAGPHCPLQPPTSHPRNAAPRFPSLSFPSPQSPSLQPRRRPPLSRASRGGSRPVSLQCTTPGIREPSSSQDSHSTRALAPSALLPPSSSKSSLDSPPFGLQRQLPPGTDQTLFLFGSLQRGASLMRPAAVQAPSSSEAEAAHSLVKQIDDELSKRPLTLDPAGYFLIFLDEPAGEIVVQHFRNIINDRGLACDPETGEVIPCDGSYKPTPTKVFRGKTAKQLSVAIIEKEHEKGPLLTMLDHANYLGRELQKAEAALLCGGKYEQD